MIVKQPEGMKILGSVAEVSQILREFWGPNSPEFEAHLGPFDIQTDEHSIEVSLGTKAFYDFMKQQDTGEAMSEEAFMESQAHREDPSGEVVSIDLAVRGGISPMPRIKEFCTRYGLVAIDCQEGDAIDWENWSEEDSSYGEFLEFKAGLPDGDDTDFEDDDYAADPKYEADWQGPCPAKRGSFTIERTRDPSGQDVGMRLEQYFMENLGPACPARMIRQRLEEESWSQWDDEGRSGPFGYSIICDHEGAWLDIFFRQDEGTRWLLQVGAPQATQINVTIARGDRPVNESDVLAVANRCDELLRAIPEVSSIDWHRSDNQDKTDSSSS